MEKRILGNTGRKLSVIGFGGIVVMNTTRDEAGKYVSCAIDKGINYFDVAPTYGNAEERLGPALQPYRHQVFLACKTTKRSAAEAQVELHQSLQRLKTDHLDLYQLHGVSSMEDVDQILASDGALKAFVQARQQGLIEHIGFSAHSEKAALRLLEAFHFDSMMIPINIFCWQEGRLGQEACRRALEQGTGILALKALACRPVKKGEDKKWPKCWYAPFDTVPEAARALSFTLSQPVTAALPPGHVELLWVACDALKHLRSGSAESVAGTKIKGAPVFRSDLSTAGKWYFSTSLCQ